MIRLRSISWLLLLRPNINSNAAAFKFGLDKSTAHLNFSSGATRSNHIQRCRSSLSLANTADKMMAKNEQESNEEEYQLFGRFKITAGQIFFRSTHSFAMVNLRPLVPGHVLVVSNRVVPLLSDLESEEHDDLWRSVRSVQTALKRQYNCDAFNVAVQDGAGAGQSVPHVHVHILPRFFSDFDRNDDIYEMLDSWAPRDELSRGKAKVDFPEDGERRDRTVGEMAEEALVYRNLLDTPSLAE